MFFTVRQFAAGGGVTCKWNPADTATSGTGVMQFENDDLDAFETTLDRVGVRATTSRSTGKRYIEFKIISLGSAPDVYVGSCTSLALLSDNGASSLYHLLWRGSGSIKNQVNGSATAFSLNDVLQFAVDLDNSKAWLARTTNSWIGGGDPAAGTTETCGSISATTEFPMYVSDNITADECQVRILGHASNQINAAPSGFTPWGD